MTELLDAPDVDLLGEVQAFLGRDQRLFIDGAFVDSASGGTFGTVDPATGNAITVVAEADAEDIDRAVRAARRAFEGPWSSLAPSQRGMLLHRLADAIEAHADEFAQIESIDNGKPAAFALAGDVALAVEHFRYFAGWATKIEGSSIQTSHPDMHVYTRREPVGVVGAIIPWNFPLLMAAWKLAPALAAGCTVVLKPAEQTPLSVLRLAELIAEAGWPEGAVNVCPGYGETAGAALVEHPDVDYIAFTGSTVVGKQIASRAADHVKHVSLELGGKSPNIVFDDADLDAAVAAAANAIFYETGQVCSAGSRLMVQAPVFDEFVDASWRRRASCRWAAASARPPPSGRWCPRSSCAACGATSSPAWTRAQRSTRPGRTCRSRCARGTSSSRRCSPACPTAWRSAGRRSSARCWWRSPSRASRRWPVARTPRRTGWRPGSGRETSARRTAWPPFSKREVCSSTAITLSMRRFPSVASSNPDMAGTGGATRSTSSCTPRPSGRILLES
jgi:hypothetical protein